jgi:uncharacterized protein (TIGR02246 family)
MDDLQDAIRRAHEKIMLAFEHGDAAAMASLYTDNARLFPPDNEMISGSEAIRSFWHAAMNKGIKSNDKTWRARSAGSRSRSCRKAAGA